MFQLPETFISSSLENTSNLWSDLAPVVLVLLGLGIGFWIIERVVGLFRGLPSEEELLRREKIMREEELEYWEEEDDDF